MSLRSVESPCTAFGAIVPVTTTCEFVHCGHSVDMEEVEDGAFDIEMHRGERKSGRRFTNDRKSQLPGVNCSVLLLVQSASPHS